MFSGCQAESTHVAAHLRILWRDTWAPSQRPLQRQGKWQLWMVIERLRVSWCVAKYEFRCLSNVGSCWCLAELSKITWLDMQDEHFSSSLHASFVQTAIVRRHVLWCPVASWWKSPKSYKPHSWRVGEMGGMRRKSKAVLTHASNKIKTSGMMGCMFINFCQHMMMSP